MAYSSRSLLAVMLDAPRDPPHPYSTRFRSRRDSGFQTEAIREIGGHVVLAAGDMNIERSRLAKRNDPRIEAMNQCAKGPKAEFASVGADIQAVHRVSRRRVC